MSIVAHSASFVLLIIVIEETEEIAASASPLKPRVSIELRSHFSFILLVAWRFRETGISSLSIPQPLSVTLIRATPPFLISATICVAPESIEFSISSLSTEAGLSTTSPAAIKFAISKLNTLILLINYSNKLIGKYLFKLKEEIHSLNGSECVYINLSYLISCLAIL